MSHTLALEQRYMFSFIIVIHLYSKIWHTSQRTVLGSGSVCQLSHTTCIHYSYNITEYTFILSRIHFMSISIFSTCSIDRVFNLRDVKQETMAVWMWQRGRVEGRAGIGGVGSTTYRCRWLEFDSYFTCQFWPLVS